MRYAALAFIALSIGALMGWVMYGTDDGPKRPEPATIQETTLADGTRCAVLFYRSAVAINCEWSINK